MMMSPEKPANALPLETVSDEDRRAQDRPLVLVVDDNDDHRSMFAMYLTASGFRVVEASDGTSTIGKARILRPDVILLDLYMPGLKGWQTCQWLKTSVETTRIPIIAITGHAVEQAEREAMKAGCDRFVVKGANPEDVIQAIREVLARGRFAYSGAPTGSAR